MNCCVHNEEAAVAACIDCGKGLCKECAKKYEKYICDECNLNRTQNDQTKVLMKYIIPSIILFIGGILLGIFVIPSGYFYGIKFIFHYLLCGYILAGFPWGWKLVTRFLFRVRFPSFTEQYVFMKLIGFVTFMILKIALSMIIGLVALPINLINPIITFINSRKLEKNILKTQETENNDEKNDSSAEVVSVKSEETNNE